MPVSKIDQIKAFIWMNDQLLFLYIRVDRYEVIIRKASTRVEMRVCQCTRFSLGSR